MTILTTPKSSTPVETINSNKRRKIPTMSKDLPWGLSTSLKQIKCRIPKPITQDLNHLTTKRRPFRTLKNHTQWDRLNYSTKLPHRTNILKVKPRKSSKSTQLWVLTKLIILTHRKKQILNCRGPFKINPIRNKEQRQKPRVIKLKVSKL